MAKKAGFWKSKVVILMQKKVKSNQINKRGESYQLSEAVLADVDFKEFRKAMIMIVSVQQLHV